MASKHRTNMLKNDDSTTMKAASCKGSFLDTGGEEKTKTIKYDQWRCFK